MPQLGSRGARGEVYIRCDFCGDSKDPNHAHFAVFKDGGGYCLKCRQSKRLSIFELLAVTEGAALSTEELRDAHYDTAEDEEEQDVRVLRPALPERLTLLDTYADQDKPGYYGWQMRDAAGNETGWHFRNVETKWFLNEGERGFGYVGERLYSTPDQPIVLVEGPYDVVKPHYVSTFGCIGPQHLAMLQLQTVICFPDPDVLDTVAKRKSFETMLYQAYMNHRVFVQGYLLANGDPDEATLAEFYRFNGFSFALE